MLNIKIYVDEANVKTLKSLLRTAAPEVKSSHRCEGLARGLGFGTYAALKAKLRSDKRCKTLGSAPPFTLYFKQREFHVKDIIFYRAIAYVAIADLLEDSIVITPNGLGYGHPQLDASGKRESGAQLYARATAQKRDLLSKFSIDQFILSSALLSKIPPTKTVRSGTNSYRLKHIVKNYSYKMPDGSELGPFYVSNGAVIAAAICMGFKHEPHGDDLYGYASQNTNFSMSKKAVDQLDIETRPNGAFAETRKFLNLQRERQRLGHYF